MPPSEGRIAAVERASAEQWDAAWSASPHATFTHSRAWAETWQAATGGRLRPTPWWVRLHDGATAVVPLCFDSANGFHVSSPGGTYGGWLGEAALARARAQRLSNRAHGLAQSLRGMGTGAQPALHARLPSARVPILLVAGSLDAKFAAIASDLAGRLPNARAQLVPGAGHACHLEQPGTFLRIARRFFGDAEARRRDRRGDAFDPSTLNLEGTP